MFPLLQAQWKLRRCGNEYFRPLFSFCEQFKVFQWKTIYHKVFYSHLNCYVCFGCEPLCSNKVLFQPLIHHVMLLFLFFISFYRTQVSLGSGLWVPVSLSPRALVETLLHFLHSSAYYILYFRTIVRSVLSSHGRNFQHIFVLILNPPRQQIDLAGTLYKTHRCNYPLLHCLLLLCDQVSIKYNE